MQFDLNGSDLQVALSCSHGVCSHANATLTEGRVWQLVEEVEVHRAPVRREPVAALGVPATLSLVTVVPVTLDRVSVISEAVVAIHLKSPD